jgi:hypothetical protein
MADNTPKREEEPTLPRQLETGEFFCHLCQDFFKVEESASHNNQHFRRG